ncbi:MAG: toll/interleukin-1 receptor domain-containing protein [Methylococcales bacterium]|nr:toll/interleukin-1 receptor domain-containing protein [Methylococcales bacterium]
MKKYAAFLSFASHDIELVKTLSQLFKDLKLVVYFAPEKLPKGSEEWQTEILCAIKDSTCLIPILTPQSIIRPWLLYELGAADITKLPILKARTSGVSDTDIQKMPGKNTFVYDLGNENLLKELVLKVCEKYKGADARDNMEPTLANFISTGDNPKKIRALAKRRKVFIGGSMPLDNSYMEKLKEQNPTLKEEEILANIVKKITLKLLENGFYLSSCPDIGVGRAVMDGAFEWCQQERKNLSTVYSMQGMFIHSDFSSGCSLEKNSTEELLIEAFKCGFVDARKKYLIDHEFFILIGGNERAELACKAAKELEHIKFLPIGCFGGTALNISKDKTCVPFVDKEWDDDSLNRLLDTMKNV